MRPRIPVPVVVGALLLGALVVLVLQGPGTTPPVQAAPALPARALDGAPVTLAGLRGRTVIVHFWASWCEPCEKEAPQMRRLARHLGPGTALVGVDWSDTRGGARAFVRRHGWRFPVLVDGDGRAGERYKLVGLPTTFIVDPRGRLVARRFGPQTADGLQALAAGR